MPRGPRLRRPPPQRSRPDPRITPADAARELLRRRGLSNDAAPFLRGLGEFARGEMFPDAMVSLCEETFGLMLPLQGLCADHSAPGAYLLESLASNGEDAIVWAARGAGKTADGALLTLIESGAYPRCQTVVLGGSGEQSQRMYEHSTDYIDDGDLHYLLAKEPIQSRMTFRNGSRVSIAMASQKSVRGPHVQRLRLDEVDEFDPAIYRAALMMRQSKHGITGAVHIYSTMHHPGGLMDEIVSDAADSGRRVYTWCIWDVAEKCEGRDCGACVLEPDCKGICKDGRGYYKIDDIIALRTDPGSDEDSWQSELLCRKPGARSLVWPSYNEAVHMFNGDQEPAELRKRFKTVVAGVDWGYENPAVIVVIGEDAEGVLWIPEEFYQARLLDDDLGQIAYRLREKWGVENFFCDPSRPDSIAKWRRMGLRAYGANNDVERGITAVGARFQLLAPHNRPRLLISKDCENLRREIKGYRRRGDDVRGGADKSDGRRESVIKKNDHGPDGLRYGILGLTKGTKWTT